MPSTCLRQAGSRPPLSPSASLRLWPPLSHGDLRLAPCQTRLASDLPDNEDKSAACWSKASNVEWPQEDCKSRRKLPARHREQRGYLSGNVLRQCHIVQRCRHLAPRHAARPILAAAAADGKRAVVGAAMVNAPLVIDPLLDCNRMARGVNAVRMWCICWKLRCQQLDRVCARRQLRPCSVHNRCSAWCAAAVLSRLPKREDIVMWRRQRLDRLYRRAAQACRVWRCAKGQHRQQHAFRLNIYTATFGILGGRGGVGLRSQCGTGMAVICMCALFSLYRLAGAPSTRGSPTRRRVL